MVNVTYWPGHIKGHLGNYFSGFVDPCGFPDSGFHVKTCVFWSSLFQFSVLVFHLFVYILHMKYVHIADSQQSGIRAMEESYGGMFKLTGVVWIFSHYVKK